MPIPTHSQSIGGPLMVWSPANIRSVASVTKALRDVVAHLAPSALPRRVDGPFITSLVATSLDTTDGLLATAGVRIRVESDRQLEPPTAKTRSKKSVVQGAQGKEANSNGRWVGLGSGRFAFGPISGGPPAPEDPQWTRLLQNIALNELQVVSWERVERTTWVVHDGDGLVFLEVVLDEERHLGTQHERTEMRAIGLSDQAEAMRLDIGDRLTELADSQALHPPPVQMEALSDLSGLLSGNSNWGDAETHREHEVRTHVSLPTDRLPTDRLPIDHLPTHRIPRDNGLGMLVAHRFTRSALDTAQFLESRSDNTLNIVDSSKLKKAKGSKHPSAATSNEMLLFTAAADVLVRVLPSSAISIQPTVKWLRQIQTLRQQHTDLLWATKRLRRWQRRQSKDLTLLLSHLTDSLTGFGHELETQLADLLDQHHLQQAASLRTFVMDTVNVRTDDVGHITFAMLAEDLAEATGGWMDNGQKYTHRHINRGQIQSEDIVSKRTQKPHKPRKPHDGVSDKHFENKRSRRLENVIVSFQHIGPLLVDHQGPGPKSFRKFFEMATQTSDDFEWLRRRRTLGAEIRRHSGDIDAQPTVWLELGGELKTLDDAMETRRGAASRRISELDRALATWSAQISLPVQQSDPVAE